MEITIFGRKISFEKLKKDEPVVVHEAVKQEEKPCRNRVIYNVNTKSVNIITCDGDTYNGWVEPEAISTLKDADDYSIIKILTPKQEVVSKEAEDVTKQEQEIVSNYLDIFDETDDFEVIDKKVYFKGIKSVNIPPVIVASFIEILTNISYFRGNEVDEHSDFDEADKNKLTSLEQEYQSLKAFTAKLLTSPRQESIEQVLNFCRHNDMRISKRGNIIAYRRVREHSNVNMPDNTKLAKFVKASVKKVKKWKKGVKNYEVYLDSEGKYQFTNKGEVYQDGYVGNLHELANNQSALKPKSKVYSSSHNYGKYTFAIGDIYKAEDGDIDVDAGNCASGGLHFCSKDYDYSGFGEISICVLINPAKTITIPINEMQKGRTTEMKIACINPNEHGIHIDEALIEKADEEFDEYTLEELKEVITNKTMKPLSVEEEVTQLSIPEVVNIKEILSKKVVKV